MAILASLGIVFRDTLIETFGIGIGVGAGWIGLSVLVAWRHPRSLLRRWHRWLAFYVLGVIVFGVLAFFKTSTGIMQEATLGGTLGRAIIGDQDAWGVLRLVGITLVGVALIIPYLSWRFSKISTRQSYLASTKGVHVLGAKSAQLTELYQRKPLHSTIIGWLRRSIKKAPATKIVGVESEAGVASPGADKSPAIMEEAHPAGYAPEESPTSTEDLADDLQQEPEAAPLMEEANAEASGIEADVEGESVQTQPEGQETRWALPPIDLLEEAAEGQLDPADNERRAALIEEALNSYGIEAKVIEINPGPAVTQFGVEPGWFHRYKELKERDQRGKIKLDAEGNPIVRLEEVSKTRVKVDNIAALDKDLALALAAPSIRIEAPVPGKSIVGIEVPNSTASLVALREVIQGPAFQKLSSKSKLALALGKGNAGEVAVQDLAAMPHLLIAGATGSGKSVAIASLISCLLMHATPDEVRFLLIDPKRVELVAFQSIPHLITPVIVDVDKVVGSLRWINLEMKRRYERMAKVGVRNIKAYNRSPEIDKPMPYLVVAIDELADLMMAAPYEVEHTLTRLAQLGRATGIHLVVATQRPSVDVVTGLIKANFPTRISFAVASIVDSRTILDCGGAEKLLGSGDMLYLPQDAPKPKRFQGTFISEPEVQRLVGFWSQQRVHGQPSYMFEETPQAPSINEAHQAKDSLVDAARDLAIQHNRISTSLLQRRLNIGYPRAARLIDLLEEEGIVGPGEPGKSRRVLVRPPLDELKDVSEG